MNIVSSALQACLALRSPDSCDETDEIQIKPKSGATITGDGDGASTANKACFDITASGTTSCVDHTGTEKVGFLVGTSCNSFEDPHPDGTTDATDDCPTGCSQDSADSDTKCDGDVTTVSVNHLCSSGDC